MVNAELGNYIKERMSHGEPADVIRSSLSVGGGWSRGEIDEAFAAITRQEMHNHIARSVVTPSSEEDRAHTRHHRSVTSTIVEVFLTLGVVLAILYFIFFLKSSNASNIGNDGFVEAAILSTVSDEMKFNGGPPALGDYQPAYTTPDCSSPLKITVSADRKTMAVFGRSCVNSNVYLCQSIDMNSSRPIQAVKKVPVSLVSDTNTTCDDGTQ